MLGYGDYMGGLDQQRQRQAEGDRGFEESYAVPSGVHLVVPADGSSDIRSAERIPEGIDGNRSVVDVGQHDTTELAPVLAHCVTPATPYHPDPRNYADAPKAKRQRLAGIYDPNSPNIPTGLESASGACMRVIEDQPVPVWDVNASVERCTKDRGDEFSTQREMPCATDSLEPLGKRYARDEVGVRDDLENRYYVLSNAVLHDLVSLLFRDCGNSSLMASFAVVDQHSQRRTRRLFAGSVDLEGRKQDQDTIQLHQQIRSPLSSFSSAASASSLSETSSTRTSFEYGEEAALLVAKDVGGGMGSHADSLDIDRQIGTAGRSRARRGRRSDGSPGPTCRVLSFDSDEDESGGDFGFDDAEDGPGQGLRKPTPTTSGSSLTSGYEDMNRLLGRLVIQRRGCRRP